MFETTQIDFEVGVESVGLGAYATLSNRELGLDSRVFTVLTFDVTCKELCHTSGTTLTRDAVNGVWAACVRGEAVIKF